MILPYRKGENVEAYLDGLSQQLVQTLKPEVWEGLPGANGAAPTITSLTLGSGWTGTVVLAVWSSLHLGMVSGSATPAGGAAANAITLTSFLPSYTASGIALITGGMPPSVTHTSCYLQTTGGLYIDSSVTGSTHQFTIFYVHAGS